jgi:hypothetical protein
VVVRLAILRTPKERRGLTRITIDILKLDDTFLSLFLETIQSLLSGTVQSPLEVFGVLDQ